MKGKRYVIYHKDGTQVYQGVFNKKSDAYRYLLISIRHSIDEAKSSTITEQLKRLSQCEVKSIPWVNEPY